MGRTLEIWGGTEGGAVGGGQEAVLAAQGLEGAQLKAEVL